MGYKVIITGAHGFIGGEVLLECLQNDAISEVLIVSRWPNELKHQKLKELIIPDFLELDDYYDELTGFDACFYCAELPIASLDERIYAYFAVDVILSLASRLLLLNPNIVFSFLSKASKREASLTSKICDNAINRTEVALSKLIFRRLYFFRTEFVSPSKLRKGSIVFQGIKKVSYQFMKFLMPNKIVTAKEIGLAMINSLIFKYPERVIVSNDIHNLSACKSSLLKLQSPPLAF